MKFAHVTIHVTNLEESVKFYEEVVGLEVARRIPGDFNIVFMSTGSTEVELIGQAGHYAASVGEDISLGFEVESLPEQIEKLKERGIEPSGVIQPNPRVRYCFFPDPDGWRIQFVEHVK